MFSPGEICHSDISSPHPHIPEYQVHESLGLIALSLKLGEGKIPGNQGKEPHKQPKDLGKHLSKNRRYFI